jgi:hypothetical protein
MFAGFRPINESGTEFRETEARRAIMKKEEMMRRILRNIESDFFKISRDELDKTLEDEWAHLSEITYSEVEELYYALG